MQKDTRLVGKETIKVLSYTIKHIKNKWEELSIHLFEKDPDVIMIQETHRDGNAPQLILEGYFVFESRSTASIGENRLLTFVKNNLKSVTTLANVSKNIIIIKVLNQEKKWLYLCNVYYPAEYNSNTLWVKKMCLMLSSPEDFVLAGDWNIEKKKLVASLKKDGIKHFATPASEVGTRSVLNSITTREIDFALSNVQDIITDEKPIMNWHLSDHFPIEFVLK